MAWWSSVGSTGLPRLCRRTSGSSSSSLDESGGEMMAPFGIPRSLVTGGGDCRTLVLASIPCRSSDVDSGDGSAWGREALGAEGVLRCFIMYEADRGSEGRELLVGEWWNEGLRLTSGDVGADAAGDLLDGGV